MCDRVAFLDRCGRAMYERLPGIDLPMFDALAFLERAVELRATARQRETRVLARTKHVCPARSVDQDQRLSPCGVQPEALPASSSPRMCLRILPAAPCVFGD